VEVAANMKTFIISLVVTTTQESDSPSSQSHEAKIELTQTHTSDTSLHDWQGIIGGEENEDNVVDALKKIGRALGKNLDKTGQDEEIILSSPEFYTKFIIDAQKSVSKSEEYYQLTPQQLRIVNLAMHAGYQYVGTE
jgi:predicted DNA binding protein